MKMTTVETRPLRLCEVCGGLDDHPRHVQTAPADTPAPTSAFLESLGDNVPTTALAQLMNPRTSVRHIDCCAAEGCAICTTTESITNGARGDKLLATIQSGVLDDLTSEVD